METTSEIQREIEELGRMTVRQLRQKYLEVSGEESRSNHKQFLFRSGGLRFGVSQLADWN